VLQEDILRFETRFSARMYDAFRALNDSPSTAVRRQSQRQKLFYSSAAFDIALGPVPEQNLLDMIVFVELVHDVFRDYWLPKVFKEEGAPVLRALDQSTKDLAKVAMPYLTPDQIAEVRALVDNWHLKNPGMVAVETVRLSDFSAEAGAREQELEGKISGVFAPVIAATAEANRAILLGERGLHYALRAPFFLRMQSTVALQDSLNELQAGVFPPGVAMELGQLRMILEQTKPVVSEAAKITDILARNPQILGDTQVVLEHLSGALNQMGTVSGGVPATAERIKAEVRGLIHEIFWLALLVVFFMGVVYVLARLAYERLSARREVSDKDVKKAA
jgi:hypothetical protein